MLGISNYRRIIRWVHHNDRGWRGRYMIIPTLAWRPLVRSVGALDRLKQVLVFKEAISNFFPCSIDLIELVDVVLIRTKCLMIDLLNTVLPIVVIVGS